jgi:hypothetical protein
VRVENQAKAPLGSWFIIEWEIFSASNSENRLKNGLFSTSTCRISILTAVLDPPESY